MEAALYLAQRGLCFHCGAHMLMSSACRRADGSYNAGWTREHIIPRSKGGGRADNIVLAHRSCNERRGRLLPTPAMIERARAIWKEARRLQATGEVRRIMCDRQLRAAHLW